MTDRESVIVNGKEVVLYREIETGLYRFSKDAVDLLLKSLEENEQYKAIGTVEELKAFRSNDFTQDLLNMGYTKGLKDGYVKAIDDFAERIKQGDVIEYMGSYVSYEAIASFIDEIAECLKGGATDEG